MTLQVRALLILVGSLVLGAGVANLAHQVVADVQSQGATNVTVAGLVAGAGLGLLLLGFLRPPTATAP